MSKEDDDALCAAQARHMEHPVRTDRITLLVTHRNDELEFFRSRLAQAFVNCEAIHMECWIPVDERLPDRGVWVLVCYECGWKRVEVGKLRQGNDAWMIPGAGTYNTKLVTHWMPLPEVPK